MELPETAVRTLSDTAWGAIWIVTVVCMGSAIAYLVVYIRSLNKTVNDLGEKRTNDAKESAAEAQKLVRESLDAVGKATRAIEGLERTVCGVEAAQGEVVRSLNCRVCPGRGGKP